MSTTDVNKIESVEENKTPDKKQIEAEEKEMMLKVENENVENAVDAQPQSEGVVKSALSTEFTEEGREVKPKFIPIGAIKMPGFFTRNSDKEKAKNEEAGEKDADGDKHDESTKPRHRLQFLHSCPFTQFLHHPRNENAEGGENNRGIRMFNLNNIKYPKIFQRKSEKGAEATLASMETLEDKLDTTNDGMENVKLDGDETDGKVATKLPLKERIRQKKFIIDDLVICGVVVLVLLAAVLGVVVVAHAGPPAERPLRLGRFMTTLTACGPVEGILNEGVYNFYNIPYAVPPIREKRFTYAQPLNNLSMCWNGTREAHKPGPVCLQILENGTIVGEEDCLTLDIVTPHVRYDSPLPVVVLIGANTLTGGIGPLQPSALFSRTKDVVFVKPNFRLGPFGFLALDILSNTKYPPTSGNYGLSDLLVVLQWIKYNIKHFGGDPESVILLGHRAGATLTAALTTVKKAQKLYSRVWLSSPSVIFPGDSLEQSQKNNEQFKLLSKCSDAECLRRISATEILSATPDVWIGGNADGLPKSNEIQHSWLVLDGDLLRVHAYEAWDAQKKGKTGLGTDKDYKPMVFGTTEHSAHSELWEKKHLNWTPEIVERIVNESVIGDKNLTAAVFSHVNKTYSGLVELSSAVRALCPLLSLARLRLGAALYVARGAGGLADCRSDVQAVLGTFASDTPEQRRYMAAMQLQFYYFAWHGRLPGESALLRVAQDALPLAGLPLCDLLIKEDVVPRYAHVD